MRPRRLAFLLAALSPQLAGCYTAMAVRMLTRCDPEWLEVRAASTRTADAAIEWRSGCPGIPDDGPDTPGPVHAGRLRIPPPDPSCRDIEIYEAHARVPGDHFDRLAVGAATLPAGSCDVLVRREGPRGIVVVTRAGDGERPLAATAVSQVTASPVPWIENVPLALVVDALYAPVYAMAPFMMLEYGCRR